MTTRRFRNHRLTTLIAASVLLAACTPSRFASEHRESPEKPSRAEPSTSTPPKDTAPAITTDDEKRAADASNAFGFDLYPHMLESPHKNSVFSPTSLAIALTMTAEGARGVTEKEMTSVLHLGKDPHVVHRGWASLRKRWSSSTKTTLSMANRLYGQKGYAFEDAFVAHTRAHYGAPLEPTDFIGAPNASRKRINDWVSGRTQRLIKDLIPPSAIDSDTRLVLVNALKFIGAWSKPFDAHHTTAGTFVGLDGTRSTVPMMQQVSEFKYAEVDGSQVAQLGYAGGDFAAMFVLPGKGGSLVQLEKSLGPDRLQTWASALLPKRLNVRLPRFKVAPANAADLSESLKSLGMPSAFGRANFDGIANGGGLAITGVFHKAFVEMNEVGTKAAAATAVVMGEGAAGLPEGGTAFHLNRPYLFLLRHVKGGTVLFVGRIAKL